MSDFQKIPMMKAIDGISFDERSHLRDAPPCKAPQTPEMPGFLPSDHV